MESVAPALKKAKEAIAKGREAVIEATAVSEDALVQHLKQYPSVQALMEKAMGHLPVCMDAAAAFLDAVDATAIDTLAHEAEALTAHADHGKRLTALASAPMPVKIEGLKAATQNLRKAADISGILDALEAVVHDRHVIAAANSWYKHQGEHVDVEVVRGALKKVDTSKLQVLTHFDVARTALAQAHVTLPAEANNIISLVDTEVTHITAKVRTDVERLLALVDDLVVKVFAA